MYENKKEDGLSVLKELFVIGTKKEKLYLFFLLSSSLCKAALTFVAFIFPSLLVMELTGRRRLERLALLLVGMLLLRGCLGTIQNLAEKGMEKRSGRFNQMFRLAMGQKAMGLAYSVLEDTGQIEQIRTAKDGLDRMGGVSELAGCVGQLFQNILVLAGSIWIVSGMDLWLILLAVGTIVLHTFIQSRLKKIDMNFWDHMVGYNNRFFYIVSVVMDRRFAMDIRLFDADKTFYGQMQEFVGYIKKEFGRKAVDQGKWSLLTYLADILQQCLVYGYLAWKLLSGAISLGNFTLYTGAIRAFTDSASKTMETCMDIAQCCHFLTPALQFLHKSAPSRQTVGENKESRPCIELRDVSFRYPGRQEDALSHISLQIPYGQKLCIVGMNGAGKTTLAKLIMGLYEPTGGSILIDGKKVQGEEAMSLFSAVFQDYRLLAASISENIRLDAEPAKDGKEAERVEACLKQAGLWERVERMEKRTDSQVTRLFDPVGIDLSGGEEQKLAIARALYREASVYMLDEPTAALDPKTEDEIFTRFREMTSDKTALFISHRMTSCMFSDRIAVLDGGCLIQYGTHEALMGQPGAYRKMFHAQAQYYQQ